MKTTVKLIIAGSVILVAGIVFLIIGLAINDWAVSPEFEMQTYTSTQSNNKIEFDMGAGSLRTEFYDGDEIIIEYPTARMHKTTINEVNGVLTYKCRTRWYCFGSYKIPETVVKLPLNTVFNLDIEIGAGSADIAGGQYAT